jgi:hypothetical protein
MSKAHTRHRLYAEIVQMPQRIVRRAVACCPVRCPVSLRCTPALFPCHRVSNWAQHVRATQKSQISGLYVGTSDFPVLSAPRRAAVVAGPRAGRDRRRGGCELCVRRFPIFQYWPRYRFEKRGKESWAVLDSRQGDALLALKYKKGAEALIERLEAYERYIAPLAAIHAMPHQTPTDGRPALPAPP